MPNNKTAGFSIQDAWDEAEKELEVSAEGSEETDISSDSLEPTSDGEQPAVESDEDTSLFIREPVEQANEEQPVGDSTAVEFDGGNITIGELKSGYMRQADYTQKTQEIAELRKEAQDAIAIYESLQSNPVQTVQKLWEAARQGQPLPTGPANDSPGSTNIDELVAERVEAILANDPRMRAMQEQAVMDEVNAIFADIEASYGETLSEEDRRYVLEKANEWQNPDLEAVFAKLLLQKQRADKEKQNATQNSSSTGYGGTTSVPQPTKQKFANWREAMEQTLNEEGIDQVGLAQAISNL